MKIRLLLLFVASIGTAAAGCGGGEVTGTSGGGASQIVSLIVRYYDDGSVRAHGFAMGDPLPGFNYLKIGDSTSTRCWYDVGFIEFETAKPVFGTWDRVDAEVSTTEGELSGSLDFPGHIKNVAVSDDTIPTG